MTGLTATLEARFEDGSRPRVRVAGPLELRGPLGASGLYYLRNVTAGVFAGDCYRSVVHCEPGAIVRVESSSATKVYSMPEGCAEVSAELVAESGSTLVWGPHATILHTGSALRQSTRVTLHAGARVLLAESLVMGRIAAGQRFDFRAFESRFEVLDADGGTRYREAYELAPAPDLEAAMGGRGVLTCVYALGEVCEADREALEAACATETLAGWSELPNGAGLILKALTPSLSAGARIARECLGRLS